MLPLYRRCADQEIRHRKVAIGERYDLINASTKLVTSGNDKISRICFIFFLVHSHPRHKFIAIGIAMAMPTIAEPIKAIVPVIVSDWIIAKMLPAATDPILAWIPAAWLAVFRDK